jgi:methyl-accepting chemotaxis protein
MTSHHETKKPISGSNALPTRQKLPLRSALRRWSLRVQWSLILLSGSAAIAAARYYGDLGAAIGLAQFLLLSAWFGAGLQDAVGTLRRQLDALCLGDLVRDAGLPGRDELAAISRQNTQLAYQLSQMVARIRSEAELITMSGTQATQHATLLSQRTESQAASLEQTRGALETLLAGVRYNSEQTRQADARSARAHADAVEGQQAVQASVASKSRNCCNARMRKSAMASRQSKAVAICWHVPSRRSAKWRPCWVTWRVPAMNRPAACRKSPRQSSCWMTSPSAMARWSALR